MKTFLSLLMAVLVLPAMGAPYLKDAPSSGMNSAILSAVGSSRYRNALVDMADRYVQVKLTTAQVLALNTTPVLLVATPGAGKSIIPVAVYGSLDYNSATYATSSNDDLELRYGSGGSVNAADLPFTFMEAAADARAWNAGVADLVPEDNVGIWLGVDSGNPITGNSDIYVRFYYKIVPSLLID